MGKRIRVKLERVTHETGEVYLNEETEADAVKRAEVVESYANWTGQKEIMRNVLGYDIETEYKAEVSNNDAC